MMDRGSGQQGVVGNGIASISDCVVRWKTRRMPQRVARTKRGSWQEVAWRAEAGAIAATFGQDVG